MPRKLPRISGAGVSLAQRGSPGLATARHYYILHFRHNLPDDERWKSGPAASASGPKRAGGGRICRKWRRAGWPLLRRNAELCRDPALP
ncbi:hypothetical protein WG70_26960 [Burkholderia oklahomensis EO147]|nr:hypothetical protein WG70_26960 [Burkholderia oklahomensis EO147]AOI46717.1 hypothetical protein WI23_13550 [Burkholderia oklahomensis C6786]KUY57825.1 hypothetical protein WG70_08410 [Burkholderia oklahomensis EO147]KUY62893.1 hypothetical protein WI23_08445 [Burkholderia oklahomensis C6786]